MFARMAPGGTVEIMDVSVAGSLRRTGVGRAMVETLIKALGGTEYRRVYAFTRRSNLIAREFWAGLGFRETAFLHDFYAEPDGDNGAILFVRRVNT